jgi:hypothetical protein
MLPGTACADRHAGIDDVGCLARCQQSADVRRIRPVEVRNVSRRLTPASKAAPGIKPLTCPRYPAPHQPRHACCRTASRRFPAAPRLAERPTPPRHIIQGDAAIALERLGLRLPLAPVKVVGRLMRTSIIHPGCYNHACCPRPTGAERVGDGVRLVLAVVDDLQRSHAQPLSATLTPARYRLRAARNRQPHGYPGAQL